MTPRFLHTVERWDTGDNVRFRCSRCGIDQTAPEQPNEECPVRLREALDASDRDARQAEAARWASDTFGVEVATDLRERAVRVAEEAIELAQAEGVAERSIHWSAASTAVRPATRPRKSEASA